MAKEGVSVSDYVAVVQSSLGEAQELWCQFEAKAKKTLLPPHLYHDEYSRGCVGWDLGHTKIWLELTCQNKWMIIHDTDSIPCLLFEKHKLDACIAQLEKYLIRPPIKTVE